MRILTTKLHGILDYITGLILIILSWVLEYNFMVEAAFTAVSLGVIIITMSIFTDYETGIIKSIPIKLHLNIDVFSGLVLAGSPWIFNFANQVYLPHLILGIFQFITAMLTTRTALDHRFDHWPGKKKK